MPINALIIDDSKMMRKMVMKALGETNLGEFDFSEAGDGVEALEQFNPKQTDIVFVDWNMPNMDGIELVKRLRAQYPKKHLPIVMITTEKLAGKMQEAVNKGVDSFISKPFTAAELQKRLGDLIEEMKEKSRGGFFQSLLG